MWPAPPIVLLYASISFPVRCWAQANLPSFPKVAVGGQHRPSSDALPGGGGPRGCTHRVVAARSPRKRCCDVFPVCSPHPRGSSCPGGLPLRWAARPAAARSCSTASSSTALAELHHDHPSSLHHLLLISDTLSNRLECHKVPRLPCKTTWQPAWKHSKRRGFAASPIDTATPQENERRATRHVDAEKTAFRARLPPILQFCEHHQTGWNVKKCHVCHAKQHDNLLGNIRKGQVFQLPP